MNYKFELDEWLPRLPLAPNYGHYSGEIITGPNELCNNEHLRSELYDQFEWGPAVPADVFVMADGEPPDRWATKIGGLPYRSPDVEWPEASDGRPLTFIGQINFTDSTDITGKLPGDLLLVYADNLDGEIEVVAEWENIDLARLVESSDLPEQPGNFKPCFGHLARAANYPKAKRLAGAKNKIPLCRGIEVHSDFHLLQYQATQIGSAPFLIQPSAAERPGQILCTISSVQPNLHSKYPWVNRAEPLMPPDEWNYSREKYLMLGDVGCIHIWIDDDGELYFDNACY